MLQDRKTRPEFGTQVKNHDWYYMYSDDHRYYTSGARSARQIQNLMKEYECPFTWAQLQSWAHNMILERFAEEEPGCWYRQPRKYKYMAPAERKDLVTEAQHDEITQWFALGADAQQLANLSA